MPPNVILRGKPSAIPIIAEWVILGVLLLIMGPIVFQFFKGISIFAAGWIGLVVLMLMLVTARAFIDLIAREFQTVTLTDSHLIREQGILDRNQDMIPLERVQSAHVRYALVGQILDYGNLIVTTAGSAIKIRNLPHPTKWEQEILKRTNASS